MVGVLIDQVGRVVEVERRLSGPSTARQTQPGIPAVGWM